MLGVSRCAGRAIAASHGAYGAMALHSIPHATTSMYLNENLHRRISMEIFNVIEPQLGNRNCNVSRKLTIRASSGKNLRGRNANPYFDEEIQGNTLC
jgi:hypothetical protein